MNRCEQSRWVQDYLDDELPERQARAFRRHAETCASCAAELALFRRAFEALAQLPLSSPSPALSRRLLGQVLPSQVRRRWVARVGWGYAAALAVCVVGTALALFLPGPRELMETLSATASRRLVESVAFVLNALAFAALSLANGWGWVAFVVDRMAPLVRAIEALLAQPPIRVSLALAGVACVAVLWWMHPRERSAADEVRHVGVLGF